jgi:hypothetical protein
MPRTSEQEALLLVDDPALTRRLSDLFLRWIETGEVPEGLFSDDLYCDLSLPTWRRQGEGLTAALALRSDGHPWPGRVVRSRFDPTPTGFVLEWSEAWDHAGDHWYCRELMRAEVAHGRIASMSVYCTGDWDSARVAQHAEEEPLTRP